MLYPGLGPFTLVVKVDMPDEVVAFDGMARAEAGIAELPPESGEKLLLSSLPSSLSTVLSRFVICRKYSFLFDRAKVEI